MTKTFFICFIVLAGLGHSQTNKFSAQNNSKIKIEGTYSSTSGNTTWTYKFKSNGRLIYKRIDEKEKSRVYDTGIWHLNKDTLFYTLNNQITLGGPLLYRDSCLLDLEDHKVVFVKIKK